MACVNQPYFWPSSRSHLVERRIRLCPNRGSRVIQIFPYLAAKPKNESTMASIPMLVHRYAAFTAYIDAGG